MPHSKNHCLFLKIAAHLCKSDIISAGTLLKTEIHEGLLLKAMCRDQELCAMYSCPTGKHAEMVQKFVAAKKNDIKRPKSYRFLPFSLLSSRFGQPYCHAMERDLTFLAVFDTILIGKKYLHRAFLHARNPCI